MKFKVTGKQILKKGVILSIIIAFLLLNFVYNDEVKQYALGIKKYNTENTEGSYNTYQDAVKAEKEKENSTFVKYLSEGLKKYYTYTILGDELEKEDTYTDIGYEYERIRERLDKNTKGETLYIYNATQLKAFSYYVNSEEDPCEGDTIILMEDVDLGYLSTWYPISADSANAFLGTFEGNFNTISIAIDNGEITNTGLFGVIGNNGTVKAINMRVSRRTPEKTNIEYFGLIAGINNGTIYRCNIANNGSSCNKIYNDLKDCEFASKIGLFVGQNNGKMEIPRDWRKIDLLFGIRLEDGVCGENNAEISSFPSSDITWYADVLNEVTYYSGPGNNNIVYKNITGNGYEFNLNIYKGETYEDAILMNSDLAKKNQITLTSGDKYWFEIEFPFNYWFPSGDGNSRIPVTDDTWYNGLAEQKAAPVATLIMVSDYTQTYKGEGIKDISELSYERHCAYWDSEKESDRIKIVYSYVNDGIVDEGLKLKVTFDNIEGYPPPMWAPSQTWKDHKEEITDHYYFLKDYSINLGSDPTLDVKYYGSDGTTEIADGTQFSTGDEIVIKATTSEAVRDFAINPITFKVDWNTKGWNDGAYNGGYAKLINTSVAEDGKVTFEYSYIVQDSDDGYVRFICEGELCDLTYDNITINKEDIKKQIKAYTAPQATITAQKVNDDDTLTNITNGITNAKKIRYTITFNEEIEVFDSSAITVENGTIESSSPRIDNGDGTYSYTIDVTEINEGNITLTIAEGAYTDLVGNKNIKATNTITVNKTTMTLSGLEILNEDESKVLEEGNTLQFKMTFGGLLDNVELYDTSSLNVTIDFDGSGKGNGKIELSIDKRDVVCSYTVAKGDYGNVSKVEISGEIGDTSGNRASIDETFTAEGGKEPNFTNNVFVDAAGPSLKSFTSYKSGNTVKIEAKFNQEIDASTSKNIPSFKIHFDEEGKSITVANGVISGDTITWTHTMQEGNNGKIILEFTSLDFSGIKDEQGYSGKLEKNISLNSSVSVDTEKPTLTSITAQLKNEEALHLGNKVIITARFSENVSGTAADIYLKIGEKGKGPISFSEINGNKITWEYEIGEGDNGELIINKIDVTNLKGADGNTIEGSKNNELTLNKDCDLSIDTSAPTVDTDSITVSKDETYIYVSAEFNDRVKGEATLVYTITEADGNESKELESSVEVKEFGSEPTTWVTWKCAVPSGLDAQKLNIKRVTTENLVDDASNAFENQDIELTIDDISIDNKAPELKEEGLTVEVLDADKNENNLYKAGTKIIITTEFTEVVNGNASLTIKFGNTERILERTNSTGDTIIWEYEVASGDNGNLSITSLNASELKDNSGNSFKLAEISLSGYTFEDITADTKLPTLAAIVITADGVEYPDSIEDLEEFNTKYLNEEKDITIKATFSEAVQGSAKLKLKFGADGQTRTITCKEIDGEEAEWNFTPKYGDNGILIIEGIMVEDTSLTGQVRTTLLDLAGNGFETEDKVIKIDQEYSKIIADTNSSDIKNITAQKVNTDNSLTDIKDSLTNAEKIQYTIITSEVIENLNDCISVEGAEKETLSERTQNSDGTYTYILIVKTEENTEENFEVTLSINGYIDQAGNTTENEEKHTIEIDKLIPRIEKMEINQTGVQSVGNIINIVGTFKEQVAFEKDEEGNNIIPELTLGIEYEDNKDEVIATPVKVEDSINEETGEIKTQVTWQYTIKTNDYGNITVISLETGKKAIDMIGNENTAFYEVKNGEVELVYNDITVDAVGPILNEDGIGIDSYGNGKGQAIYIYASFNEDVTVDKTKYAHPILKFGGNTAKGEIKQTRLSGSKIEWKYTIAEGDDGTLSIEGINVIDETGNITLFDQYGNPCEDNIEYSKEFEEVIVDTKSPTLQKLEILSPSEGTYQIDTEIKIKATFDENIFEYGAVYPEIKFGGKRISNLYDINVEINEKTITWTYYIKEGDNGKLTVLGVDLENLYDEAGNQCEGGDTIRLTETGIKADTAKLTGSIEAYKVEVVGGEEKLTPIVGTTNANTIRYIIYFNKDVVDFNENSISYENATKKTNISYNAENGYYSIDLTPNADASEINFWLVNEYCKDTAGNTIEDEINKVITIDKTGPEFEYVEAKDSTGFNPEKYGVGDTILIEAYFNENLGGFTPMDGLKLSFSESGDIKGTLSDATISGNKIYWTYKVAAGDEGTLSIKNSRLGTVSDSLGNTRAFQMDANSFDNIIADTIETQVTDSIISKSSQIKVIEDAEMPIIKGINPKTIISDLKDNLESKVPYEILDENGSVVSDEEHVGTGYQIRMESGKTYTLVVIGDITGDGRIVISELAAASRIAAGVEVELSDIKLMALDINGDGQIAITELGVLSRLCANNQ